VNDRYVAHALASFSTMPALILNRSSRVIPGFRGTPAGMRTMFAPLSASGSSASPTYPLT